MKLFPIVFYYCLDILEVKDMSSVKHNIEVSSPFVRCLIILDDNCDLLEMI